MLEELVLDDVSFSSENFDERLFILGEIDYYI
ncbi:hypothetical protein A33I_17335 [Alkalihalophilus marmarensis DSM 21297]|uniref:Uncharacterized protein n=1 Tax=Alkalihalophilus marmarensis DSM 21297 TaxID=1188261 RepID=U6SMX4_9BACI|nr:hypothetical protein A33I_17335 [Alkalihalophilus marmarensis DSM 21297]